MLKVYGMLGCSKCTEIKAVLIDKKVEHLYIEDAKVTMQKAKELKEEGLLVELTAPLIIKDGKQIKHEDIKKLI